MRSSTLFAVAILSLATAGAQASGMYPQGTTPTQSYNSAYTYPAASNAQVLRLPQGYVDTSSTQVQTHPTVSRTGYGTYPAQYPEYQPAPNRSAGSMNSRGASSTTMTVTTTTSTAMMPTATTLVDDRHYVAVTDTDTATNVQLRKPCTSDTNHRSRNKGINTSTTVFDDCLN